MFAEQRGLEIMQVMRGFDRPQDISDVGKYFNAIIDTFLLHIKRLNVQVINYHIV